MYIYISFERTRTCEKLHNETAFNFNVPHKYT
jgi:hypothetical protein